MHFLWLRTETPGLASCGLLRVSMSLSGGMSIFQPAVAEQPAQGLDSLTSSLEKTLLSGCICVKGRAPSLSPCCEVNNVIRTLLQGKIHCQTGQP